MAGLSGKDDWPSNDWFPYLNALFIFILSPKIPTPNLSGSQNPYKVVAESTCWSQDGFAGLALLTPCSVRSYINLFDPHLFNRENMYFAGLPRGLEVIYIKHLV